MAVESDPRPGQAPGSCGFACSTDDGLGIHDGPVRQGGEHSRVLDDEGAALPLDGTRDGRVGGEVSTEVVGVSAVGVTELALPLKEPEMSPR